MKATIPPERLLVYEPGEGWERLCAFLSVPVPDTPFPRENTTEAFKAMVAERKAEAERAAADILNAITGIVAILPRRRRVKVGKPTPGAQVVQGGWVDGVVCRFVV